MENIPEEVEQYLWNNVGEVITDQTIKEILDLLEKEHRV